MRISRAAALVAAVVLCVVRVERPVDPRLIAIDAEADGAVWLSSQGHRVRLGPRALNAGTATPLEAQEAPSGEWLIRWPWAQERLEPSPRGVELKWRFDQAPLDRDLELSWPTSEPPSQEGEGARAGAFAFGRATWLDSAGLRVTLALNAGAAGMRIVVPREVLQRTVFPAELDPLIRVQPVDAPVFGPVGSTLPMASNRGSAGAVTLVGHQRAIECWLYDDDGGVKSVTRLDGGLFPLAVEPSADQLLALGQYELVRLSADCTQLLERYPRAPPMMGVIPPAQLIGVDGGWAMLELEVDGGLTGTRYDLDGGIGATALLAGTGISFGGAGAGPWVVVVRYANNPVQTPIDARWYRPESWTTGNVASLVRPTTSFNVSLASVPGQVLIAWDLAGRRFQSDGTPIDFGDQVLPGNTVVPFGPQYLSLGFTGTWLVSTGLMQTGPLPVLACSQVVWGPKVMCMGLSPSQARQITWYDQALNSAGGPIFPARRMNEQGNVQLVGGPSQGWVAWNDDRDADQHVFAARIDTTGAISAPISVAPNRVVSATSWFAGPVGEDLLIAPTQFTLNNSVWRVSQDAGTLVANPIAPSTGIDFLTGWVGVSGDTVFDAYWGTEGTSCPFAPHVRRMLFDGGILDTPGIMLGCGGFGYGASGAPIDGGVWLANNYSVGLADGGAVGFADLFFVPLRGAPTPILVGANIGLGYLQNPIPVGDGVCYPRYGPNALECTTLDGGFTDVLLPEGALSVAYDGRRFHFAGCVRDGGLFAGVVTPDGGLRLNANAPNGCSAIQHLGPDHLGYVGAHRVDAGDDDVQRVFLFDYAELDEGAACLAGNDCLSGFCSDGVCCDSACGFSSGGCQTCAPDGHCRAVACPPDAGPGDAGEPDSGDAGEGDAGAGPRVLRVGCGCQSLGALPVLAALAAIRNPRRRTNSTGSRAAAARRS